MERYKLVGDCKVMAGTRSYELLDSKDPHDHKKAKQLMKFCDEAYAVGYEYEALMKLRKQYGDVL